MGSVNRRIGDLERRLAGTANPGRSETFGHLAAILDELALLKSGRAVYYRGGVRMEPENIPRKILGPDYTHADLSRLAVTRSVESGKVPAERTEAYIKFLHASTARAGKDPDAVVEWERHVS
jgi:hypothetical protein